MTLRERLVWLAASLVVAAPVGYLIGRLLG